MKTVYQIIYEAMRELDYSRFDADLIADTLVDRFQPTRTTHFGRVQGDTLWFDFPGKLQMFPESRTYTRESLTITTGWEEKE